MGRAQLRRDRGAHLPFDETLALVRELVQQPAMRVADFERSQFDHVQWLQQLMQDPQWQADWQFGALLEGRKRPDLLASVRALTLDDVRNFYQSVYRSGEAQVVVSGDLAQERVMKALGFLVEPAGQPPALHSLGWRGQQAKRAIYLLDNPGRRSARSGWGGAPWRRMPSASTT